MIVRIAGKYLNPEAVDHIETLPSGRSRVCLRSGEWVEVWAPSEDVARAINNPRIPERD